MKKRIGFITHNLSGTDGVSLEILKWYKVLERMGHECYFFGAEFYDFLPTDRTYICEEANWHSEIQKEIVSEAFSQEFMSNDLKENVEISKNFLKLELFNFINDKKIDLLLPENTLTIPVNIPLGQAIREVLEETNMPAVAHHHDFYWERDKYIHLNCIADILDKDFPIHDLDNLKHIVINSKAKRSLKDKFNIDANVAFNVYDFKSPVKYTPKDLKSEIRKDAGVKEGELFFLHPVRIVRRKNIEYSIDFLSIWNKKYDQNCKLIISHEEIDEEYLAELVDYAKNNDVAISVIGNNILAGKYDLSDIYNTSDFVFFTSGYEGFGNALVETVFFQKPMLVNRYEVFIDDIEPLGLDLIKIDNKITEKTVEDVYALLNDNNKVEQMVRHNFDIGSEKLSFETLERVLKRVIT